MIDERARAIGSMSQRQAQLDRMPHADFVAAWKALVGEPPAALLTSRSDMIRILVDSIPPAPCANVLSRDRSTTAESQAPAKSEDRLKTVADIRLLSHS